MDREKIMSALDCRANDTDIDCRKCDYYIREDKPEYCDFRGMLRDALALLKEQEAEPEIEGGGSTWWYVCSECRGAIDDSDRYCRHCGARMQRKG